MFKTFAMTFDQSTM